MFWMKRIGAPIRSDCSQPASADQERAILKLLEREPAVKCTQDWSQRSRHTARRENHLQGQCVDWQLQIYCGSQFYAPCSRCQHDLFCLNIAAFRLDANHTLFVGEQ